jgi:opacity protein-like surface antigen
MLRNRLLVLLGGCFLMASAAWADGVAYVDCANHPEDTQVFAKPRRTPESVAALPCGERFTILLNGFIFSRIQTKDGKIGYVYSNLISPDHSGAAVLQPTSARSPEASSPVATPNVPAVTATVVQHKAAASAPAQPAQVTLAEPSATQTATASSTHSDTGGPSATAQAQPVPAPRAPSSAPTSASATPSSVPDSPATAIPAAPAASTQPEALPARLAAPESAAPAASAPETPATAAQPEATPAAQPEPAPAEPAASPIRAANARESWEKPNAGLRTVGLRRMPLIELFGGYGFARLDGGAGTWTNLNGIVGSFGWNVKPWLQLVADSSYSTVTVANTKNVIYGNHYGPRLFRRGRNRWGLTPFAEALVGGSRADTTVSGTGGYSASENSFSMKLGGGLDFKPTRHFEIRLIDIDYYRTSFGPNVHQNNYWASAGIVIRLFGGSE